MRPVNGTKLLKGAESQSDGGNRVPPTPGTASLMEAVSVLRQLLV